MDKFELQSFIKKLPKAEQHIHLGCAVAPRTVLNLSECQKMQDPLPAQNVEDLRVWSHFTDFTHFIHSYIYSPTDLVRIARNAFLTAGTKPYIMRDLLRRFDQEADVLL